MAEGWARHLIGDSVEAHYAGIEPTRLDPLAVKVMAEAGVDISRQRSKHVRELQSVQFDYALIVCDNRNQRCPIFPGGTVGVLHKAFDDPPRLAAATRSEEEALTHYRRVRDEIRAFIETLPGIL